FLKRRDACDGAACMKTAYEQRLAVLATPSGSGGTAVPAGKPQAAKPGASPAKSAEALAKRQSWYEKLGWPQACEEDFKFRFRDLPGSTKLRDAADAGEGVAIYPLGGGRHLAIAECDSFAYQISFCAVVYDETGKEPPKTVTFRQYDRDSDGTVLTDDTQIPAGWPEFDAKTKTLTVFTKARGIGDCGSYTVYGFGSGIAELKEARAQACFDDDSKIIADPAQSPKVEKP
ncbi:MAG: DUF1176 domain-containing protein, partial [Desulfovibrionaceae bacterium]|nr:DUF1176 domain-containing protein [Desulfovibrionaceae bacterium]